MDSAVMLIQWLLQDGLGWQSILYVQPALLGVQIDLYERCERRLLQYSIKMSARLWSPHHMSSLTA